MERQERERAMVNAKLEILKFRRRIEALRRGGRTASADKAVVVPVKDAQDKYERLVRGMLFFQVPPASVADDGSATVSDATGASLILGNQDGKFLYVFISLDDARPSYVGNVADHKLIPGDRILKHPHMAEARYQEFKDPDGTEEAAEEAEKERRREVYQKFDRWADKAVVAAWKKNPVGKPYNPAGRESETLFEQGGKSEDVLRRFVDEDADFIIGSGEYSQHVIDKAAFVRDLCRNFFFTDPNWWFGLDGDLLDILMDDLVYEYPGVGTNVLDFRKDNLPDVSAMWKRIDAAFDKNPDDTAKLDEYMDAAVAATVAAHDTAKALHTLDVVKIFDNLAGYMVGALAPDNAFHMGTLVGRDLLSEDGEEAEERQGIYEKAFNEIQRLAFVELLERPDSTMNKVSDLVSLWHFLKSRAAKEIPSAKLRDELAALAKKKKDA